MVNFRARKSRRLGTRYGIFLLVIPVILVLGWVIFILIPKSPPAPRLTVVIAGSPVVVWSCDASGSGCVVVTIPSSYVVDAVHGYGHYSLDALWRLGFIDKRGGSILAESVADTLGLSHAWYIGENSEELPPVKDGVQYGRKLLSIANVSSFVFRKYRSDLPFYMYWAFARQLSSVRFDDIIALDLSRKQIIVPTVLPDQTTQEIVSPDQVDIALKGMFEDQQVRKEALTVAVQNTTSVPNLGNHAARLLSSLGVLVVSVGNSEPERSGCVLEGNAETIASKTAKIIQSVFHCARNMRTQTAQSDLMLRIGTDFAARYLP